MTTNFILESSDRDDGYYYTRVEVAGDGDLDHYFGAFKAFLLAAGHHPDAIAALMPDADDIEEYRCAVREELNREMEASQHPFTEHDETNFCDEQMRERRW